MSKSVVQFKSLATVECFAILTFRLGQNAFSQAYINFINPRDIWIFQEKFDSYVFLDEKGMCVNFRSIFKVFSIISVNFVVLSTVLGKFLWFSITLGQFCGFSGILVQFLLFC